MAGLTRRDWAWLRAALVIAIEWESVGMDSTRIKPLRGGETLHWRLR